MTTGRLPSELVSLLLDAPFAWTFFHRRRTRKVMCETRLVHLHLSFYVRRSGKSVPDLDGKRRNLGSRAVSALG